MFDLGKNKLFPSIRILINGFNESVYDAHMLKFDNVYLKMIDYKKAID